MKALMILGSVVGFLIGGGFSVAGNCPWSTAIWRACVAALIAGLLARWWGRMWLQGLQSAIENHRHPRPTPVAGAKPNPKI